MKRHTLKILFVCFLVVGSVMQVNAEFPEISKLEQDNFTEAVRAAQWSAKTQRWRFAYKDREFFMINENRKDLVSESFKHELQLVEIQYIKAEPKDNKVHYYYSQIRGSCYSEDEVWPFSMHMEIIETEKK